MAVYKLTTKGQYGDMPKGYTFQVASRSISKPDAQDVEKEICTIRI